MKTASHARGASEWQLKGPRTEWPYLAFVIGVFVLIVGKALLEQAF
jgi:hypothetical protein